MAGMKVDVAFLCDHAVAGDKIHAHGIGVDTILARSVPVRHPQLFFVLQVRVPGRVTEKKMEIKLIEPDGKSMLTQGGALTFTTPAHGKFSVARFSMGYYALEFRLFGEHILEILLEGEVPIRLPLELVQVSAG